MAAVPALESFAGAVTDLMQGVHVQPVNGFSGIFSGQRDQLPLPPCVFRSGSAVCGQFLCGESGLKIRELYEWCRL